MSAMTAWLWVGQSKTKKRERRARWNREVIEAHLSEDQRINLALRIFAEELEEDAM